MQTRRLFLYATLSAAVVLAGCSDEDETELGNPDVSDFPSVGIPDQNSLSIAASELNSRSGSIDGTTVDLTVRLADQLNNNTTIPDGTTVRFAAEGGSVEPMCTTIGGTCSVVWTSQAPRPAAIAPELSNFRASVLAWVAGTESFTDNNSNGLFDDGDTQISDIGEPFLDKNADGTRDNNEEFVNFPIIDSLNSGGVYDVADGLYSGPNCAHSTLCSPNSSIVTFGNIILTMSTDGVRIQPVAFVGGAWQDSPIVGAVTLSTTLFFLVTDVNGNPPIIGTSVDFSTDVGTTSGSTSFTVPNTNIDVGLTSPYPAVAGGLVYAVSINEDPMNADVGTLTVTVTPPNVSPTVLNVGLIDP